MSPPPHPVHAGTDLGQCTECNRLWRAYAAETIKQFQLQGKLRVATIEHRRDRIVGLTADVAAAEAALGEAREAMLRHERTHAGARAAQA